MIANNGRAHVFPPGPGDAAETREFGLPPASEGFGDKTRIV